MEKASWQRDDSPRVIRYINDWEENKELFLKEGFTLSIAKRVFTTAMLTTWDAYYLFYYAKRIPDGGTYLEIGSFIGGSMVCIILGAQMSSTSINFISIEPRHQEKFYENIAEFKDIRIEIIQLTSDEAVGKVKDNSVDLLFVDGGHKYEQVKKDIGNYWPNVKPGGIFLGHDYELDGHPGVKRAVDEILKGKFLLLKNSAIWKVEKKCRTSS